MMAEENLSTNVGGDSVPRTILIGIPVVDRVFVMIVTQAFR